MSDQSDTGTPVTVDDVWVNRLAMKLGILTAQNERLLIEAEMLQQRIQQLEQQTEVLQGPPTEYTNMTIGDGGGLPMLNGEVVTS